MMLTLSPNPNNRLYTDLNSYLQYLGYLLGARGEDDRGDVSAFETALRERFGTRHAACVFQCRVGLYLAVKALIRPGQDVILSPYTIVDVVNMVIFAGGRPVFADVEQETCNISPTEVERLITPDTGAVLITHLHGLVAEAHRIKEICARAGVPLVEDCAQAFGAEELGVRVGAIGDVGVYSFEMHKNLPTWLGGVLITDRDDVIAKARAELQTFTNPPLAGLNRKIRSGFINDVARAPIIFQLLTYPVLRYGRLKKVESINRTTLRKPQESARAAALPDVYKSRYSGFQARIGLSMLRKADRDTRVRIEHAMMYYDGLRDIDGLILPPVQSERSNAPLSNTFLWFPLQYRRREALLRFMFERGRDIAAGHFTNTAEDPRYADFQRDCPNATKVEKELLYLPTYPGYSRREVAKNIQVIREFFKAPPLQPAE